MTGLLCFSLILIGVHSLSPTHIFSHSRRQHTCRARQQPSSWSFYAQINEIEQPQKRKDTEVLTSSHISTIKVFNLAGVVNEGAEKVITIVLGDRPNLVAVTGETGCGKSLLFAQCASLVSGGKASASLLPNAGDDTEKAASVEMGKSSNQHHCQTLSW
jgi:predicted ribonuclease YlaK